MKTPITLWVLLTLFILLTSCYTQTKLKPGDTVKNRYNRVFTLGKKHYKPGRKQVFFYATRNDGVYVEWLPTPGLKKIK